jgi:CheY-like chemotaxis protein
MLNWDTINTWTVLIVEDERDNAEVIAGMMTFYGAAVRQAENGKIGLEALVKDGCPTLILLDLSMPIMDGWEMLKALKADPRTCDIPIVALSAHAMVGDKERVLAAGFDGYLSKPVNVRTLMADLRAAIEEAAQFKLAQSTPSMETLL